MDPPYPVLASPLQLRGAALKNRLVHASISTQMAKEACVTSLLIQYYVNRARGGAGMIVTEPLSFARHQDLPSRVRAWDDSGAAGLGRWAEAVETEGCRLV